MAKQKRSNASRGAGKKYLSKKILDYMNEHEGVTVDYKTIARALGIRDKNTQLLISATLQEMADKGLLHMVGYGRYMHAATTDYIETTVRTNRKGDATATLDDGREVFIPAERALHALDGDTVRISTYFNNRYRTLEGEVLSIVKRGRLLYAGVIEVTPGAAFFVPDNRHIAVDFYIPHEELHGARYGDKVVVELLSWPMDAKSPIASVRDVLGKRGENNAEMNAILTEFELPYSYPDDVTAAAEALNATITDEERAARRDFTKIPTMTIDPDTAKDFDDAISFQQLENGHLEVGVHIADVTHYVTPSSTIDEEAYNRATSIYLVDRTVPMLPERLCNDICSLRPNEERLAFSVVFELDGEGNVMGHWVGRTIIKSDARLTYEQAQEAIEGGDMPLAGIIRTLNGVAQAIRKRRFEDGAVDFASEEVKFKLDDQGKPLDVIPQENNESHQLIEEFMLLANRTIAEMFGVPKDGKEPRPFVYRVHDRPDNEKLAQFLNVMAVVGHPFHGDSENISSKQFSDLVRAVRGEKTQPLVDFLAVRSMAKAVYTTNNIGHYGLAFDYYTHFTSPIRRYPDMMVHRLLADLLAGLPPASKSVLEERCVHSSEMEKLAADAERASIKYKQVEYMGQFIGQRFDGIISGVKDFGFYVEISSNKCEGMVHISDLTDGYYDYIEEEFALVGGRPRRKLTVGDEVTVEVAKADLENKYLDFHLVAHLGEPVDTYHDRYGDNPRARRDGGRERNRDGQRRGGDKPSRGGARKGNSHGNGSNYGAHGSHGRGSGRERGSRGSSPRSDSRYGEGSRSPRRGPEAPSRGKSHGRLPSRRRPK